MTTRRGFLRRLAGGAAALLGLGGAAKTVVPSLPPALTPKPWGNATNMTGLGHWWTGAGWLVVDVSVRQLPDGRLERTERQVEFLLPGVGFPRGWHLGELKT